MRNPFKRKKDFIRIIKSEDTFHVLTQCPGYENVTIGLADLLIRAGLNIGPMKEAIHIAHTRLQSAHGGQANTKSEENG